ncbi:MAG: GrpB family protein [Bacilli bacterium]|nr:GrpB family protein [Bacilli bacterium]
MKDTQRYEEFIMLRDYLLQNEEEAVNYSNYKKELLDKGITERKEYREAKSQYVEKLLKRAGKLR